MIMTHPFEQFKYCPKCGSSNFVEHNFKSKHCNDCNFTYYFNPSSSTANFIVKDDKLLVVIRGKEPAKGTYDLPGGFADCYENGEECAVREIKEEVGLDVVEAKYLFSNSNRYLYSGFTVHTLDMFFLCKVKDTDNIQAMDDAAEFLWVPIDEINPDDFGLESVRQSVEKFKNGYAEEYSKYLK